MATLLAGCSAGGPTTVDELIAARNREYALVSTSLEKSARDFVAAIAPMGAAYKDEPVTLITRDSQARTYVSTTMPFSFTYEPTHPVWNVQVVQTVLGFDFAGVDRIEPADPFARAYRGRFLVRVTSTQRRSEMFRYEPTAPEGLNEVSREPGHTIQVLSFSPSPWMPPSPQPLPPNAPKPVVDFIERGREQCRRAPATQQTRLVPVLMDYSADARAWLPTGTIMPYLSVGMPMADALVALEYHKARNITHEDAGGGQGERIRCTLADGTKLTLKAQSNALIGADALAISGIYVARTPQETDSVTVLDLASRN